MPNITVSTQSETDSVFLRLSKAFLYFFVTDLSVMARQVNTILCSAVGCHSTTHCCLHDQSVHTTGIFFSFLFIPPMYYIVICSVKSENVSSFN